MRVPSAPSPVACLLAALWLTACGGDPTGDTAVPSPAPPTLEPIATFGCLDCEGPELLAQPGVTVGASGRVYVFDTAEPHVRVLEPDGTLGATFGQTGEGPGEIRMPLLLGVLEDGVDGIWVQEASFLHHYDGEGTPIESRPYAGRVPLGWTYDLERRLVYLVGFVPIGDRQYSLLRYSMDGGDPEVVAPWNEITGGADGFQPDSDSRWSTVAVAPDGRLALVDVRNYRVRILSSAGAVLDEFDRAHLPRPRKFEWRLERERKTAEERGDPAPDPIGPHLAAAAAFDGAGRLWLPTLREPGLIDVFSAEGEYLGEVSAGGRIVETALGFRIAGDRMAAVLFDENETATVHVWRILDP